MALLRGCDFPDALLYHPDSHLWFAPAGDGTLKGSGRSIQGLHMRDALERLQHFIATTQALGKQETH